MRSPRTDRLRSIGPVNPLRRLDARLVLTISAVALLGLLISGIAISQILPGYFTEQATQRLRSDANATYRLLEDEVARVLVTRPGLLAPDVRGPRVYQQIIQRAADDLVRATVEVWEGEQLMARAEPRNVAGLEADGLAPDAAVPVVSVTDRAAGIAMPAPELNAQVTILVRDPYTSRVRTLERVGFALLAAGIAAFAVALLAGVWAASRLTRPLARLREASVRIAEGNLAERVPPAEIAEVDALGSQFNAMADQLEETLTMLSDDRDRLRAFIADVSHELRTPIAALRTFTELQRDGGIDEATRTEFLDRSDEQIRRLEWMSTNLLDLSRIDAGIFPMELTSADLRDPLRSVVEAHAEEAERRGVSLSSEVPSSAGAAHLRPRADRAAGGQPDRKRAQVHPAWRIGLAGAERRGGRRGDRGARHRTGHPGRRAARSSSTASTAAPTRARRAPRGAALGWRSPARSPRCTVARSWCRASRGRARPSASACRGRCHAAPPRRKVNETSRAAQHRRNPPPAG